MVSYLETFCEKKNREKLTAGFPPHFAKYIYGTQKNMGHDLPNMGHMGQLVVYAIYVVYVVYARNSTCVQ